MKQINFNLLTHLLFIIFLGVSQGYAQKTQIDVPIEWGKVLPLDFAKDTYDEFPEAEAVILGDYGAIEIEWINKAYFRRHIRIRILKEEALERGNIEIPYYYYKGYSTCSNIKAQSFTKQNGEIVKTKIKKSDIFDEEVTDRWRVKKFAIPNVKVGTIIEYSYQVNYTRAEILDDWEFHNDIPTLYSGFTILTTPSALDFRYFMDGDALYQKYKGTKSDRSHWSLTNIPPLNDEPFCANPRNYANIIHLQLHGGTSNGKYIKILADWEQIVKEQLWENSNFNYPFRTKKSFADQVQMQIAGLSDQKDKMKAVYKYCQEAFVWNNKHSFMLEKAEMKKFTKGMQLRSGSINLYLTAMCQEAGLEAYPFLMSTRKNGNVHKSIPFISQFNHLIACVVIDGKPHFLDASVPNQPYNILPVKDMNEFGLLVRKKEPAWLNLTKTKTSINTQQYDVNLKDLAKPSYKATLRFTGVHQVSERNKLLKKGDKEYLKSKFPDLEEGFTKDTYTIKDKGNIEKPLIINCEYEVKSESEDVGELVYVPIFSESAILDHPFQNEKRYYPVEFPYSSRYIFSVNLEIPDGYKVEDVPENTTLQLSKYRGYSFSYTVSSQGQKVNVAAIITIQKGEIKPKDYPELRQFFTDMIGKMEEVMVLKKIEE